MNRVFTMTRGEVADSDNATLRASILAATGNETGTASIMRSLERLGTDPSIEYFEFTEVGPDRRNVNAAAAWRVRAARATTDDEAEIDATTP
jgi:hypothetical protein